MLKVTLHEYVCAYVSYLPLPLHSNYRVGFRNINMQAYCRIKSSGTLRGCIILYSVFTKKRSQWYIIHFLFITEYWGVFQTKIFSVAVFEIKSNVKNRLCKYLGTLIIFMISKYVLTSKR